MNQVSPLPADNVQPAKARSSRDAAARIFSLTGNILLGAAVTAFLLLGLMFNAAEENGVPAEALYDTALRPVLHGGR